MKSWVLSVSRIVVAACVLLAVVWSALPAAAASAKDVYAKLRKAAAPASGIVAGTLYLPTGNAGVQSESDLAPRAKLTATHKSPKSKYEIQALGGAGKPVALIRDGAKVWLLTGVGATELATIPDKAQDTAVRAALLIETDGGEPKLAGEETVGGKPADVLELPYFGQKKRIWAERASGRPLRAELDGWKYDWVYDTAQAGLVRRIVVRDGAGAVRGVIYQDPPNTAVKIGDEQFDFKQSKSRVGFFEKVGDSLGGKPEVMASAGARGLDEEIKRTRSGKGGEDYNAVERMEKVVVTGAEVEEFLREGKLGKYAE